MPDQVLVDPESWRLAEHFLQDDDDTPEEHRTRVASLAAAIQQAVEAWCEGEEDEAGGTAGCTCVPPGPYLTAEEVATYQEACNEEPIEKHQENCALRMRHSTEAGGTDA